MSTEKLNIVQVIPAMNKGGAERLVLDITAQLEDLGHNVHIITFRPENRYTELSEGKKIEVIPSQVVYSLSGNHTINTAEFDKRIREIKPDIIHSHLLESEFVSRHNPLDGVTYLTHWHGCHPPTNPRKFGDYFTKDGWWNINAISKLKKQYAKCDNQFLCISEFIRGYVKRALGSEDSRLNVILNGTDLSNFKFEEAEKDKEVFTMVVVGSFHAYKNQIFLLKVMKALKEAGKTNFKLQLLGDGVERANLEAFAKENQLGEMVEFLGYVTDPSHYMNRAHALVHSAIDEPFGLILLEAMSCKLPIVAFRSGGIPEVVKDGKTGYLTSVNDTHGFMNALIQLQEDPKLCNEFGKVGQIEVQDFAIEKYAKRLENLYFDLIKKKGQ